jgi:hypothetical protein
MRDFTKEELDRIEDRAQRGESSPTSTLNLVEYVRHIQDREKGIEEELWAAQEVLVTLKDEATLRDERDTTRQEAKEQAQLANAMELLCSSMITERDAYRDKLARLVANSRARRTRKRRR